MQTSQFPWHWFQTNWACYFSPHYPYGMKNRTASKCLFEAVQKLSVKLEIITHKSLTRTNFMVLSWILDLQNHNTATNVIKFSDEMPLVKHTEDKHDHSIHGLVGLFGTIYLAFVSLTWLNDVITVPANIKFGYKNSPTCYKINST